MWVSESLKLVQLGALWAKKKDYSKLIVIMLLKIEGSFKSTAAKKKKYPPSDFPSISELTFYSKAAIHTACGAEHLQNDRITNEIIAGVCNFSHQGI